MEEKTPSIHVRGGFSESIGMSPCNRNIQVDDLDNRTRILLSNELFRIFEFFFEHDVCRYVGFHVGSLSPANEFCKSIISNVFNERNTLPSGYSYTWRTVFEKINEVITGAAYNEVLDIIWYCCDWIVKNYEDNAKAVYTIINTVLEQEFVGYRFVQGKIIAVTNKIEIDEIEQACAAPFKGCQSHLEKAVTFLSDRDKKDYKNCIKESISAVESVCQIITESDTATLGTALKKLKEHGLQIHPALESAFGKLYGYTSDEGGIRHCEGLFVSNVSFEEAKFMLVSCSAFVNYLISEYGKQI